MVSLKKNNGDKKLSFQHKYFLNINARKIILNTESDFTVLPNVSLFTQYVDALRYLNK